MKRKQEIYLDNAATTKCCKEALAAMARVENEIWGNPSSSHNFGLRAAFQIEESKKHILRLIGAGRIGSLGGGSDNIVFTSGATEANCLAILGLEHHLKALGKTHIITSKSEHKSVIESMKEMQRRGFEVTYLDTPDGVVKIDDFASAIRSDTGFASIMFVNNELGTINNINAIGLKCLQNDVIFHSDCVQAAGYLDIIADMMYVDMITLSAHKINGPKGVGCLYVKYPTRLSNVLFGGGQQGGLRPGTENLSGVVGFGAAAKALYKNRKVNKSYIDSVATGFAKRLESQLEGVHVHYHPDIAPQVLKILSVSFYGVDAETLRIALSEAGVYVSAGSACNGNSSEPSHVLMASGYPESEIHSTIRVSFSKDTSFNDVVRAVDIITKTVNKIRSAG